MKNMRNTESHFSDITQDVRTEYILRARLHDDEMAIVLKGHLLVEYLLNRIISEEVSECKTLLNQTFSRKVSRLSKLGFIQGSLLENIGRLNTFRNRLAHQLDYSVRREDMLFTRTDGKVIVMKLKRSKYPQRRYYRLLCHGILTQLINHMLVNLNVDPRWLEESCLERE